MRDIKFRFWDGENMLYTEPTKQKYDYEDGLVLAFSHEGYEGFNCHEKYSDDEQFEVMQYTGLKDKNGKEIYEGDLIAEIDKINDLNKWGVPLIVKFGEFISDQDSFGLSDCTI